MIPGIESLACGPLAVPDDVMAHVVQVESARNPFAIGVVGGRLERQPRTLAEAAATVGMLEREGRNYSVGLAQVNRTHFARLGWSEPERGFDVCGNLRAGAEILADCLQRNEGRWGDAFSCYYSGNPSTGYAHGYVQKVMASMAGGESMDTPATRTAALPAIALRVADAPEARGEAGLSRRVVGVARADARVERGQAMAPPMAAAPPATVSPDDGEDPARVF